MQKKQSLILFDNLRFGGIVYEKQSFFAFFLSSMIWFTPLRTVLIEVGNELIPGTGILLSRISILLFFAYSVYPVSYWMIFTKDEIILLGFIIFQCGRALIFNENDIPTGFSILMKFLIQVFPYYIIARQTTDWTLVKQKFYKSSIVTIILMAGMTIFKASMGQIFHNNATYSMFWGFLIGRASTVAVIAFFDTKETKYLISSLISMPFVILYGTRTVLVCICFSAFIYIILEFLKYKKKGNFCLKPKSIILLLILFAVLIAIICGFQRIKGREMNVLLPGYRILYSIAHGDFFNSGGRVKIYKICINLIADHPFFGTGILGDRIEIAKQFGGNFAGDYAHNIILEWMLQFGIIIGGLLLIGLAVICENLLFRSTEKSKQIISVYLVGFGIAFMMISGTTFDSPELWVLLGMGVHLFHLGGTLKK